MGFKCHPFTNHSHTFIYCSFFSHKLKTSISTSLLNLLTWILNRYHKCIMFKTEFMIFSKSVQPTAFPILTNGNFVLSVIQSKNFGVILDSSFFGTLALKHVGVFLKNDFIGQSGPKVPIHEIRQQSIEDLKTPKIALMTQPLTLEDIQKNIKYKIKQNLCKH